MWASCRIEKVKSPKVKAKRSINQFTSFETPEPEAESEAESESKAESAPTALGGRGGRGGA